MFIKTFVVQKNWKIQKSTKMTKNANHLLFKNSSLIPNILISARPYVSNRTGRPGLCHETDGMLSETDDILINKLTQFASAGRCISNVIW